VSPFGFGATGSLGIRTGKKKIERREVEGKRKKISTQQRGENGRTDTRQERMRAVLAKEEREKREIETRKMLKKIK